MNTGKKNDVPRTSTPKNTNYDHTNGPYAKCITNTNGRCENHILFAVLIQMKTGVEK